MKKLMWVPCLILCINNAYASGKLPPYEIPVGMTERGFAVSYITGQTKGRSTGKEWEAMSEEERTLIHCEDTKFRNLGNDVKLAAYCEVLSTNMDKLETVKHIIGQFYSLDGRDILSCGHPEALRLTREVVSRGGDVPGHAWAYLIVKGNRGDADLLEKASDQPPKDWQLELVDALRKRAEENFVRGERTDILQGEDSIIPSVANTGPQGVYVYHILRKAWGVEEYLIRDTPGIPYPKFPEELLKMEVTFDEDGLPVSSVDLSKYGLSMPVIRVNLSRSGILDRYTAIFPHETEVSLDTTEIKGPKAGTANEVPPPPPDPAPEAKQPNKEKPSEQPAKSPPSKIFLWLAILTFLAVLGGAMVWRKAKRK